MEAPNEALRLWCGPFHNEALYLETGRRYVEYLINEFQLKNSGRDTGHWLRLWEHGHVADTTSQCQRKVRRL